MFISITASVLSQQSKGEKATKCVILGSQQRVGQSPQRGQLYEGHRSWAEGLQKPDTGESTERTELEQEKFRAGNKAQDRSMVLRGSLLASWTYTYSWDCFKELVKADTHNCSTYWSLWSLNIKDVKKKKSKKPPEHICCSTKLTGRTYHFGLGAILTLWCDFWSIAYSPPTAAASLMQVPTCLQQSIQILLNLSQKAAATSWKGDFVSICYLLFYWPCQ